MKQLLLFCSLLLILISTSGYAKIPNGGQLSIDFTWLRAFEFDDYNLTFTDNGEAYKVRNENSRAGLLSIGDNTTKTGADNSNLVTPRDVSILFNISNDGTFGCFGDEFSVVSINIGAKSEDFGTRIAVVIPYKKSNTAFAIPSV